MFESACLFLQYLGDGGGDRSGRAKKAGTRTTGVKTRPLLLCSGFSGIIARRKRSLVQYKLEFTDVMMSVFYVPKPDAVFV